jgi:tetratricopeptide (TPR) repeat protein
MSESTDQIYERALTEMRKEQWPAAIKLLKSNLAAARKNWRFSWNIGWCYFNLGKFVDAQKYMMRANRLAPENPICKWGLGSVYLKRKHFEKAEAILTESLAIKDSYPTRISLALACLSQGKAAEAEKIHLDGIRLKPRSSERYESYGAFLSDVGREEEARTINKKASELRRVN